uniref:Uncharacterized protein n=1 Tax=Parascaris equorum TaxID=6256 RepID=A0A914R930_PAREQ
MIFSLNLYFLKSTLLILIVFKVISFMPPPKITILFNEISFNSPSKIPSKIHYRNVLISLSKCPSPNFVFVITCPEHQLYLQCYSSFNDSTFIHADADEYNPLTN